MATTVTYYYHSTLRVVREMRHYVEGLGFKPKRSGAAIELTLSGDRCFPLEEIGWQVRSIQGDADEVARLKALRPLPEMIDIETKERILRELAPVYRTDASEG